MKQLQIRVTGIWIPAIHGTLNQTDSSDVEASEVRSYRDYMEMLDLLREQFGPDTCTRVVNTKTGDVRRRRALGPKPPQKQVRDRVTLEISNICGGDKRRFSFSRRMGMSVAAIRHCRRQGSFGVMFHGEAAELAQAEWDLLSEG